MAYQDYNSIEMIQLAKPFIGAEEKEAVCKVLDTGFIVSGEIVTEFEERFASYNGTKHGIATTSGTTALETAMRALGIGPGDKVLTTPFSFIASANSIIYTGAEPVFADVDPETFSMDPEKADEVLRNTSGIKAILVVHLFGRSCDMDAFKELAERYKVFLIEDCAQSHGAVWNGRKTGSFGDISCFSFYATKNMTTGEGGMVLTDSDVLSKKCRMLINHGMEVRYYHDEIGHNYRMTNIAGAIGLCQLDKLPYMNGKRKEIAEFYDTHIDNEAIILPKPIDGHVYHQYTIRVGDGKRDAFVKHLEENRVGYGIFYPLTIPEQKCYSSYGFSLDYPAADMLKTQVVSLPIHPGLTEDEIVRVAETVNSFNS